LDLHLLVGERDADLPTGHRDAIGNGLAARAGLDRKAVADYLAGDEDRAQIAQADIEARSAGIGGVPFFIFNRKVGISGAQDPDTLLNAMEQALQEQG